jgi:hypothetical protein
MAKTNKTKSMFSLEEGKRETTLVGIHKIIILILCSIPRGGLSWSLDLQLSTQLVPITTNVMSSDPTQAIHHVLKVFQ